MFVFTGVSSEVSGVVTSDSILSSTFVAVAFGWVVISRMKSKPLRNHELRERKVYDSAGGLNYQLVFLTLESRIQKSDIPPTLALASDSEWITGYTSITS
jgi:hypothetical protein